MLVGGVEVAGISVDGRDAAPDDRARKGGRASLVVFCITICDRRPRTMASSRLGDEAIVRAFRGAEALRAKRADVMPVAVRCSFGHLCDGVFALLRSVSLRLAGPGCGRALCRFAPLLGGRSPTIKTTTVGLKMGFLRGTFRMSRWSAQGGISHRRFPGKALLTALAASKQLVSLGDLCWCFVQSGGLWRAFGRGR